MQLRYLLLLFPSLSFGAVTQVGTPAGSDIANGTAWTTFNIAVTIPAGADLCLATITRIATGEDPSSVVWDAASANEALTLVDKTTSSGAGGDLWTATYGVVSPTAGTSNVTVTAPNNTPAITGTVTCFDGTDTASVAAATNFVGEDVDDTAELDIDIASGGSAGNLLYFGGAFLGNDRDPITLSAGWTQEIGYYTSDTISDPILEIATKAAASAVNAASGASDENAGHVIELVADAPRAGYEFVTLASVSATSFCDDDTYFDPDVVAGDRLEVQSTTSPGGFAITWETDCDFSYTDATGSRQEILYAIRHADGTSFTTPDTSAEDDLIVVNNTAPVCGAEEILVFDEDEAITSIDLDDDCTDADSEQLTYSVTSGTLPNGISLTAATGVLSGTPDTEDETGVTIEFTATDGADETDTLSRIMYVVNTVTLPDYTAGSDADAQDLHDAAFPWQDAETNSLVLNYVCNPAEVAGEVISQDPVATTEVTAFQTITLSVSGGCNGKRTKGVTMPGVSIGN